MKLFYVFNGFRLQLYPDHLIRIRIPDAAIFLYGSGSREMIGIPQIWIHHTAGGGDVSPALRHVQPQEVWPGPEGAASGCYHPYQGPEGVSFKIKRWRDINASWRLPYLSKYFDVDAWKKIFQKPKR